MFSGKKDKAIFPFLREVFSESSPETGRGVLRAGEPGVRLAVLCSEKLHPANRSAT